MGETKVRLDDRTNQHKRDVRNQRKNPNRTALVQHVVKTGHDFEFDGKKILKKVRTTRTLKIHEANQIILKGKTAVNSKKDAEHVSPVFYNLIKNSVKRRNITPQHRIKQVVNLEQMFNQST